MNIVLSCTADKKIGKGAYLIRKGGKRVVSETFSIYGKDSEATLKEYVFDSLIRGLRNVRSQVEHNDLLLIELPNIHMVEWLNGTKEYKGYNKYLDEISDIIDTLDCRYLFSKGSVKDVKKMLSEKNEVKVEGAVELFKDM